MHVSEHRCLSYTQTRQGLKGKARSRESGAIRDEDLYRKARPWRPNYKTIRDKDVSKRFQLAAINTNQALSTSP
jgi:hypothetical protein